jgi:hypothetical protein
MRLYVALLRRDGSAEIVNASRPASLIAFSDAHEGKDSPDTPREMAWLVHHALGVETDLDAWLLEIEDMSPAPADLALARRIQAGETTLEEALAEEIAGGGGEAAELAFPQNGEEPAPDPTPVTTGGS